MFRDQASYTLASKTGSNGKFVSPWNEGQLGPVQVQLDVLLTLELDISNGQHEAATSHPTPAVG